MALEGTSYSNVDNCVFTTAEYGIDDDSTGANNSYLNNTFNHVGYPILIGNSDYPLPTIIRVSMRCIRQRSRALTDSS